MKKVIAVVGLGLIGGSLAAALRGFEDYEVVGVVRRQETKDYADAHGVCDRTTLDARAALAEADGRHEGGRTAPARRATPPPEAFSTGRSSHGCRRRTAP